jgi:class 3 adenylate cyclase
MENRVVTIMFMDMQGYTKRSAGQTIDEMKLFHDQMQSFVNDIVKNWDGVLIKSLGDGFMVKFESPTNAVQAGLEIQKKLDSRNAQMLNPDSIVRFRVGINTGEVGIDENGDLFGDPVNIAARIQTFADTNDVFIAESTYLAMNRNEFGAVDLGNQDLKNATREIKIYKVLKHGSPGVVLSANNSSKAIKTSGNKNIMIAGVAGVVILSLVLGFYFGNRRAQRGKGQKGIPEVVQIADQNQTNKADNSPEKNSKEIADVAKNGQVLSNEVEKNSSSQKTFLDIDSNDEKLPFGRKGRDLFSQIQSMRKSGDYASAIKAATGHLREAPGNTQKLSWALAVSQLYWENGQKAEAEKVFGNIRLKVKSVPRLAEKIENVISRIKMN